jgi:hypothetical protein
MYKILIVFRQTPCLFSRSYVINYVHYEQTALLAEREAGHDAVHFQSCIKTKPKYKIIS